VRPAALAELVARDLRRSLRSFSLAALGITVGVATLAFFLALSEAMRAVVLGRIFPIDQVEVIPPESSVGSRCSRCSARGRRASNPPRSTRSVRAPGVRAVLPRMRFAFPTSGRGGRAVFGRDVGAGEIPADGVDPSLVPADLPRGTDSPTPTRAPAVRPCASTEQCGGGEFCVFPTIPRAGEAAQRGDVPAPDPGGDLAVPPGGLRRRDRAGAPPPAPRGRHRPERAGAHPRVGPRPRGPRRRPPGDAPARLREARRGVAPRDGARAHRAPRRREAPQPRVRGRGAAAVYSSVVVYLRDPAELTG
jgi:hypothetical protein